MKTIPTLLCDFYKVAHREQYPDKTEIVYSTWTPRSYTHMPVAIDKSIVYGFQGFVKEYLIDFFNTEFFARPKADIVAEYARYIKHCLFVETPYTKHIEDLHDLGYLPLEIKALEEGTRVKARTPTLAMWNTEPEFFWLTNYFETMMSSELWKPATVATLADIYRNILNEYAVTTTGSTEGVEFQGHDFSMRGLSNAKDVSTSGHLLSFVGTDTIPAIQYLEQYYNTNIEKELVGCSVNATEHSVMSCSGNGEGQELETFRRLLEDVYPSGIISIVSDTWDLWKVLTEYMPKLKDKILARTGSPINKVGVRPDSGVPEDIICGDPNADSDHPASKGVIELLWNEFGGTVNDQGYKVLNPAVGAIYGDAITPARCTEICERLKAKGFASTNMVFGIGSFTYQYITRDTLGFAMKATWTRRDGVGYNITKDPVTDDGTKKSAKGRVSVEGAKGIAPSAVDEQTDYYSEHDLMKPLFRDGKLLRETSLQEIRDRVQAGR